MSVNVAVTGGKGGSRNLHLKAVWFLLLALCSLSPSVAFQTNPYSTRQELELHESAQENGTVFIFQRQVPDATKYDLSRIKRIAVRGHWTFFSEINYRGYAYDRLGWWLVSYDVTSFPYKSFRYGGANDVEDDAVSLYPEINWAGEEIFVTQFAFGGIQSRIRSVRYTGKSVWTVFEGTNFDGKSTCLPATSFFLTFGFEGVKNLESTLGLTTIGSLIKGCIPKTRMYDAYIESVRELWASTRNGTENLGLLAQ